MMKKLFVRAFVLLGLLLAPVASVSAKAKPTPKSVSYSKGKKAALGAKKGKGRSFASNEKASQVQVRKAEQIVYSFCINEIVRAHPSTWLVGLEGAFARKGVTSLGARKIAVLEAYKHFASNPNDFDAVFDAQQARGVGEEVVRKGFKSLAKGYGLPLAELKKRNFYL